MKTTENILKNYPLLQSTPPKQFVEVLLRRGVKTAIQPPQLIEEMVCQDCGGHFGCTCWDNDKRVWFCGNQTCLTTDSNMRKEIDRQIWWDKIQQSQKQSEERKIKKEWDGK